MVLMFTVLLKAQLMSYAQPPFGPYTESKRLTIASGYLALMPVSDTRVYVGT